MRTSEPAGAGGPLIDRRSFLVGLAATALAAGCSSSPEEEETGTSLEAEGDVPPDTAAELPPVPPDLPEEVFALGVASGDPLPDSVVLWTRIVSDPLADDGGVPAQPLPVGWEVARDRAFDDVVASGDAVAEPALAHSVHVDASGLEPDTWYWYRFTVGDRTSPVGRTRTAPASGAEVERLRFAFASCQDYEAGHYTAHEHLSREDVDLVLFLGDYIYEHPPGRGGVRRHRSAAPVDLAGYRRRYGEVKADPALQAAHAHAPWLCTWDDHEVEGNYAGGHPGDPDGDEEAFRARREAAYQAWYEHMPVRAAPPDDGGITVHRSLDWGDLARLYLLDGRQHRSDQPCDAPGDVGPACAERGDPDRTMLGAEQEAWLEDQLAGSRARWNVVGQQTVLTANPLAAPGTPYNLDQWDGYPAARRPAAGGRQPGRALRRRPRQLRVRRHRRPAGPDLAAGGPRARRHLDHLGVPGALGAARPGRGGGPAHDPLPRGRAAGLRRVRADARGADRVVPVRLDDGRPGGHHRDRRALGGARRRPGAAARLTGALTWPDVWHSGVATAKGQCVGLALEQGDC